MFSAVFVGGTFDQLHVGHQSLLTRAYGVGERVIIGLTSDTYTAKYKSRPQRPFADRRQTLVKWLENSGFAERTRIIAIDDPYEPAASDAELNAIVVTVHNRIRADELNAMRSNRGLTPLAVIEAPLIAAEDGLPVSSTRVSRGEIDEAGHLVMPEALRTTLAQPLGILHTGRDIKKVIRDASGKTVLTVGDVATKAFLDHNVFPALSVIDLQVKRQPFLKFDEYTFPDTYVKIEVASGPGYISRDARKVIQTWAERFGQNTSTKTVIVVKGEEDLLSLPVLLYAPDDAVLFYGQPKLPDALSDQHASADRPMEEGLVEVPVTDKIRERVASLLSRFT